MQASNLDDSSNQGAGEACLAHDINELANFIDPSITMDRAMNALSTETRSSFDSSDSQMKQNQNLDLIRPDSLGKPANVATYTSYTQQFDQNGLLQVPKASMTPHKRPLSPLSDAFPKPGNVDCSDIPGSLSRRNIKSKPLASAKKAQQVSEELASEIAKLIDLYKGPPEEIEATIKNKLLLTFNPGLSRKRSAQMASLSDDLNHTKKRRITCDQCSTTTARQCDMRCVERASRGRH